MKSFLEVISGRGSVGCQAIAKPEAGKAGELLADFLESDLQGGVRSTEMVLEFIGKVRSGELPSWTRNGNAYLLKISPDKAILEDLYPSDTANGANYLATLSLDTLEDAAQQWATAIKALQPK